MAKPFQRKYTPAQWEAVFDARFARGLSFPRIIALAKSGELIPGEPFEITAAYLRERCATEARARRGQAPSQLATMAPPDAHEHMRTALLNLWSAEHRKLNLVAEGKRDLVRARDLARLALDISRIPGRKDEPSTKAPDSNTPGQPREPKTGKLGGALMREHLATNGNGAAEATPQTST